MGALRWLAGKKSYIAGGIMILDAAYTIITGQRLLPFTDVQATADNPAGANALDPVTQALIGSAVMALRAAVAKGAK